MRMLIGLLCLVLFFVDLGPCSGARLLFVATQNHSALDPALNSVAVDVPDVPLKEVDENRGIPCEEAETKPWNNNNQLTFRFNENRTRDVAKKEAEAVVYNVLPKGDVPPSGPSPIGNAAVDGQRLSRSKDSPAVGHMQVGVSQGASKKRVLKSTPSPGAGH